MPRREVAAPDVGAAEHRHRDDSRRIAPLTSRTTPFGKLRRVDVAHREVAALDGVADREVVGGDDRVAFGPEIAGPPVE